MKNLIIRFAKNRTCQNVVLVLYLITFAFFFIIFNNDTANYKFLIFAIWVVVRLVYSIVHAIEFKSDEILMKNKLSHILFSSPAFISEIIFVFLVLPYLFIFHSVENRYFWVISVVVWIVLAIFLAGRIGKYFEKKLLKN